MAIETAILEKAKVWLGEGFDSETQSRVKDMIENNHSELRESFYQDLEFGTGGLRGIMGSGTNRMNKYTVGLATQGLCNYVKKSFPGVQLKAAIAYDCRNKSDFFALITAEIMSANGIEVYLFKSLRPTPELSFAVRHYGCHTGVVITASHNPKEYNGYKVYWDDGGQLVAPHDTNVIDEVRKIKSFSDINFNVKPGLIKMIGTETDEIYIQSITSLSLNPAIIKKHASTKIVFTPIHGTCVEIVPAALRSFGFRNIINVPEQDVTDGNFPTVHSPNPEEPAALQMAINKAIETNAELVMATDPDGDRVGIAVRNENNEFVLLNGNQAASLIIFYLLNQWNEKGLLKGKEFIVKTIVTTELLAEIAKDFNTPCYNVLTGFKFIAEVIRKLEGKMQFIGGGEESYGYLVGDKVRDKDAVVACCFIAETMVWANENGKTLYQLLTEIYLKYGFYKEKLISLTKKGIEGMNEIQAMMAKFRENPPATLNGIAVDTIHDYQKMESINLISGQKTPIDLPQSNVLQYKLADGSVITMRPSGTEPKIKFYFGVKVHLDSADNLKKTEQELNEKLDLLAKAVQES